MPLLNWFEANAVGVYIREANWGFPIALSFHAVGMAMVMGVVIVLNLRVLGYIRGIPVASYEQLFGAAWLGFILNLLSGFALYSSHATEYTFQFVFLLKIALLAIGGILMKVMMQGIRQNQQVWLTKLIAVLCLSSWIGAIVTGRLMAYA